MDKKLPFEDLNPDDAAIMSEALADMIGDRATEARKVLDELESTLSTLTKLVADIEAAYCTDGDMAALYRARMDLEATETRLAQVSAELNEERND